MMEKTLPRLKAEGTLNADQLQTFNKLVEDYQKSCQAHVAGMPRVNYNICADLVRWGWKKTL